MSFARSARTRVLPVPHIPDGLTITPATKVRQGPQGTGAIMPDKGKVERPFRYIRQDFFLGRTFRNLDDLNAQLDEWLASVANVRVHATTRRVVAEAFAEEQPKLQDLPSLPFGSVLTVERRITHEGMVSVGGNLYSVPDATRKRVVEVQNHPRRCGSSRTAGRSPAIRCSKAATSAAPIRCIASPVVRCDRRRVRRRPRAAGRSPPLAFYDAVGRRLAGGRGARDRQMLDRIRTSLVGLRMPRALEALDHTLRRLERGELSALEAIDGLLAEELPIRETPPHRRRCVMRAAQSAVKTLAGFDFSFQPSLDRNRILALAELDFVDRAEVLHFLGPPGTGKSHLATALGVDAVKAGKAVYFCTLADMIASLAKAEREGACANASAATAAPRCSSSTRSATSRSSPAAPTSSSSSSTPATRRAR